MINLRSVSGEEFLFGSGALERHLVRGASHAEGGARALAGCSLPRGPAMLREALGRSLGAAWPRMAAILLHGVERFFGAA